MLARASNCAALNVILSIAQGHTNRQIALELQLAPQTVKNVVSALLDKLAGTNRSEAVALAQREHWIS